MANYTIELNSQNLQKPDTLAAELTRAQWDYWENEWKDSEQKTLDELQNPNFQEFGNRLGDATRQATQVSKGTTERNLQRRGLRLSAEERAAMSRRHKIKGTRAAATAETAGVRGLRDMSVSGLGQMIGIGRNVMGTAQQGLTSAAGYQAQREQAGDAMKSQWTNSLITGAAMLAAAFI